MRPPFYWLHVSGNLIRVRLNSRNAPEHQRRRLVVGGVIAAGLALIITSCKDMQCVFTPARGHPEHYYGTNRKFGLDIGATDQGILAWDVFASSVEPKRGALAGDYAGVDASATNRGGGWRERSRRRLWPLVHLQPLSIQAQTGLALAAGVASMTLRPGH